MRSRRSPHPEDRAGAAEQRREEGEEQHGDEVCGGGEVGATGGPKDLWENRVGIGGSEIFEQYQ